jgi:hypothetical protein
VSTAIRARARIRTRIGNNIVPFIRARARDDGDNGIGVAEVEHFVRDAGSDEDEVPRLVVDAFGEAVAVLVTNAPFEVA